MNRRVAVGLLAALAWVGEAARAEEAAGDAETESRPYLSALFSYVAQEDDRGELLGAGPRAFKEGKGLQLSVGKPINRWLGFEVAAFGHNYTRDTAGSSLRDYGGKIDGLFFYSRDPRFSPYFGLGVGGIRTDVKGADTTSTDPFADVGLGFMKFFELAGRELGVRGDVRYRHIFFGEDALDGEQQDDVGEAVFKVGLVVPLGTRPARAAPAPAAPAACADSDGDSVCDTADLCPETPKGAPVDTKGCPAEKPAAKGDPNQKFADVHFAFDRSELTDYGMSLLDDASKVIQDLARSYPGLEVDVAGHTDAVGTDGYNQGLSERRANVVKQYLQRRGVDGSRIRVQAYGEARPKATNDTDEGRALNRRSEVRTRAQ
jgi:OmpA-OmpF porin, OOP family